MLQLVVGHVWSLIREDSGTPEEIEAAAAVLTVTNPFYFQAMKRKLFGVAKKISFFQKGNLFPTGLVPLLRRKLAAQKIETEIVSTSLDPIPVRRRPKPGMFEEITLNDEQCRVIQELIEAEVPRGYLKAHPGFGKTEVILALYKCFRPCLAVFIVTRSGLREEAFKRCIKRLGEEPYILGHSKGPIPKKGLIVTTYHTLHSHLYGRRPSKRSAGTPPNAETVKAMENTQLLLADEIHRASGTQYQDCLKMIFANRRYGFSATPMKANNAVRNMAVRAWIGEKLAEVHLKGQVEKGRVAKAHVFFRSVGKDDPVEFSEMLGYHSAFMRAYMHYKPFLKRVLQDVRWFHGQDLPCLVITDWWQPGETFRRLISRIIPEDEVRFIHGEVKIPDRNAIKEAFSEGKVKVLVATSGVFGEGEDLPSIGSIVMACPGRDPGVLYQRIGRGIRVKLGKTNVLYVTVYLNRRHKYFLGHAKEQLKYFARNKDLYVLHGDSPLEVVRGEIGERRV